MILFEEEEQMPRPAVQLDFMDHILERVERADQKEAAELSQTFDQLMMRRPQSQGFKKVVQVRAHQRKI